MAPNYTRINTQTTMTGPTVPNTHLLAEIDDVLRTMPPRATFMHDSPENVAWLGRAAAAITTWNPIRALAFHSHVATMGQFHARTAAVGAQGVMALVHEARNDLRLKTTGPLTVAIGAAMVFDYFDELRKIVETARTDLLFVDPYLDAEFVSRYLTHVADGVTTRLLTTHKLNLLLPAVELLAKQRQRKIEVRSIPPLHDRYVLVDRRECYQSGASFKDGARNAPTTLTQITDAFAAIAATYEKLWDEGTACT